VTDPAVLADVLALEEAGFSVEERWSPTSWESELSQPSLDVLGWHNHRILELSKGESPNGDGLLGVIALRYGGNTVDLDRIVVDPRVRRQGVARELITAGLRRATDRGASEMILEVRTDNQPAVELYRWFGFGDVIVRSDYYGPGADALVMSRRLEQG
jgi:ribosomal protein S18 acetylase RimI-like enzyme